MKTNESYSDKYTRAKARVEEIKAFYNHLAIYIIVSAGIAGFNYYLDQWRIPWFLFPVLGWGIGIVGHGIGTFNVNPFTNKEWEEKKIAELLEKEKIKSKQSN
jgi:predicted membrane channel-forming protein YqfA (hemolysin III family)